MKKLIICAHPNPEGFSHKIAHRFIEKSEESGHECFLMELYSPEWKQDYLMLDEKNKPVSDPKREAIQAKISWADELVFIFPLWRFDAPAIMKNWFDTNMTSKFAFIYRKNRLLPHRLLQGKTARVIFTGGSPTRVLWTMGLAILVTRWAARFFYVGLRLRSWTPFGKVPEKRSPQEREEMLAKISRIATK